MTPSGRFPRAMFNTDCPDRQWATSWLCVSAAYLEAHPDAPHPVVEVLGDDGKPSGRYRPKQCPHHDLRAHAHA